MPGAHALKIRRDTVLYNTVYQCNKVMEEVDNTSSTFISVFFSDIQECTIPLLFVLNVRKV